MREKIGLVPLLYDEMNYGGVLQFYALQKFMNDLGYETSIIYVDDNTKFMQKYRNEPQIKKIARVILKPYLKYRNKRRIEAIEPNIRERRIKTEVFKKSYYSKMETFNPETIMQYKAVICGSDQIWNPNNARKRLFLEFVPSGVNRIIYAASLGCESLNSKQKEAFIASTGSLKHISVREKNAKKILTDCLNRNDIQLVADPTLLLSVEEWNEILLDCSIEYNTSEYIFVYMLGSISKEAKNTISDYAKKNGKKIIRISFASGESMDTENFGDFQLNNQSPQEFLTLIKHSFCVFTDSFHACVFSTLFKKQYYVFKRDGKTEMLDRIITLLDSFELSKEIIIENNIFSPVGIDYTNNEESQKKLIQKSVDFLKESLKDF